MFITIICVPSISFAGGDPTGMFMVNSSTGHLYVNRALTDLTQSVYALSIRASNLLRTTEVSLPAYCKCLDPSLVIVIVTVYANGSDPAFTSRRYNACMCRSYF